MKYVIFNVPFIEQTQSKCGGLFFPFMCIITFGFSWLSVALLNLALPELCAMTLWEKKVKIWEKQNKKDSYWNLFFVGEENRKMNSHSQTCRFCHIVSIEKLSPSELLPILYPSHYHCVCPASCRGHCISVVFLQQFPSTVRWKRNWHCTPVEGNTVSFRKMSC